MSNLFIYLHLLMFYNFSLLFFWSALSAVTPKLPVSDKWSALSYLIFIYCFLDKISYKPGLRDKVLSISLAPSLSTWSQKVSSFYNISLYQHRWGLWCTLINWSASHFMLHRHFQDATNRADDAWPAPGPLYVGELQCFFWKWWKLFPVKTVKDRSTGYFNKKIISAFTK